ncbi:MAG: molybdenum cofactor guanylyltransferase MobA [Beijerinckiaceae bacterium]|nr:molybdenum cofactor guanylyltransferase MobA [Beijerinckiaceae bacterium]
MSQSPACVILAGGLARRMGGGDKPLKSIGGKTILDRVIECVTPQCSAIALNANGDPARFAQWKLPVVADSIEGFAGPLAGVLAGMDWAAQHAPQARFLLSVAADCPFLPNDLVERLEVVREAADADICVAHSGDQAHPVIALWRVALREDLRHALVVENMRKIDRWTARYKMAHAEWPAAPVDPFFNANTPEDIAEAERLLREV